MSILFSEISRMNLFHSFNNKECVQLLDLFFHEENYALNQMIIEYGQLQTKFFVIVAGEVEVFKMIDQKKVVLGQLSAGQFFGEMNLFNPGLATATVTALTPVKTLEISNIMFRRFLAQKPQYAADFTFQLAETIVKRLRSSHEVIEHELMSPRALELGEKLDINRMQA